MTARDSFTLDISRFIRAPREKVFDAFVTESLLRSWHCPRGMSVAACALDARVGGAWRTEMKARDGSVFTVGGTYRELERPTRLAYTWKWEGEHGPMSGLETLIEVEFTEKDDGTVLRMTHSGFPAAAARDSHVQGWGSCLNRLTDLLDARGTAASLTLMGDARSSYTRTARMGFAEKGVACTFQNSGPYSPEILAVHPFGRIPALRDGEVELWETSAILRYLDESFDSPVSLTPGTIAARVRSEQWVSAVNCYLYDTMVRRYLLQIVFPKGVNGEPDRGVIESAHKEMPAQLAALDKASGILGRLERGRVRRDSPCSTQCRSKCGHARRRPAAISSGASPSTLQPLVPRHHRSGDARCGAGPGGVARRYDAWARWHSIVLVRRGSKPFGSDASVRESNCCAFACSPYAMYQPPTALAATTRSIALSADAASATPALRSSRSLTVTCLSNWMLSVSTVLTNSETASACASRT